MLSGGPECNVEIESNWVEGEKPGYWEFEVTYTASTAGPFSLHLFQENTAVFPGSPFNLSVHHNASDQVVDVAVIDTGIDYTHPSLAPNMWVNHGEVPGDGVDNDGNGFIDDYFGYFSIIQ